MVQFWNSNLNETIIAHIKIWISSIKNLVWNVVLCKYDTLVILHISDKCRSIFLFLCKMWIKYLQDVFFYYLFRFHFSLLEIIHGLCMGSSTHISYFYKFCLSQKCFPTKCIQPPPMNPSTKFQSKDRNKIEFSYFMYS